MNQFDKDIRIAVTLGQREFDDFMRRMLVDRYELLSAREYFSRYTQVPADEINLRLLTDVSDQFGDMDSRLYRANFEHAERLMSSDRELADPNRWPKEDDRFSVGQYTLMAYQLYRDFRNKFADAHTETLAETLNQRDHWQTLFDYLRENMNILGSGIFSDQGMDEQQVAQLLDYFVSEHQIGYQFLNDHDEDYQRCLLICFWLRQLPLPCRKHSGVALVVDADQDVNALLQRAYEMTDPDFRQQHISDAILAYVEGEPGADLNDTIALLQNTLATDTLELQAPEYRMTGLANFIWVLDPPRRDRLTQLFLNTNYRGFKMFEQTLVGGYLDKLVTEGKMPFEERLGLHEGDEDYEEAATANLLVWLEQINICPEHLLLYCVKHSDSEACQQWLVDLAARGELKKAAKFLNAKHRTVLMEMLGEQQQTRSYLGDFIKDKSRAVRDVITRYLPG